MVRRFFFIHLMYMYKIIGFTAGPFLITLSLAFVQKRLKTGFIAGGQSCDYKRPSRFPVMICLNLRFDKKISRKYCHLDKASKPNHI